MKWKDGDQVTVRAVVRRDSVSRRLCLWVPNDDAGDEDLQLATSADFDILDKNLNAITLVERADPDLEDGDLVANVNGERYVYCSIGNPSSFMSLGPEETIGVFYRRDEIDGPITRLVITVPEDETEDRRDR